MGSAVLPTKRIFLKDLNDVITCKLCSGYFIDATTITECLHTFCKSCIVSHLEDDTSVGHIVVRFGCPLSCQWLDSVAFYHIIVVRFGCLLFSALLYFANAMLSVALFSLHINIFLSFHVHNHLLLPQCPTCGVQIHQSYPLNYIDHDRTMQDIVLKLVPHLQEDQTERENKFYEERGLPNPKDEPPQEEEEDEEEEGANTEETEGEEKTNEAEPEEKEEEEEGEKQKFQFHREDEQVNISLEPEPDSNLPDLKMKFIRCSSQATINHVKKYVALKLWNDASRFKELDIICDEKFCGKDHALKLVVISNWKCRPYPVELKYRPKDELY